MRVSTTLHSFRLSVLSCALLLCGVGTGCFRSLDMSKVRCVDDTTCPTDRFCSRPTGSDHGTCQPRSRNGTGGSGPGIDGPTKPAAGGAGGGSDTSVGGSGGATTSSGVDSGMSQSDAPLTSEPPACTSDNDCTQTGHCVDGVCCDSVCDGQCESCKEAGFVGICKAITGSPLPSRTACGGTDSCKGQCDGKNGKTCAYPDESVVCAAAKCDSGKVTTASVCNSAGGCTTPASSTCPNSQCASDGSAKCASACTAASCPTGSYCDTTGACLPKQADGSSCSASQQCASGNCVDGVCCDGKCDGQCESCKETGSVGKCKAVKGDPISTHAACGGTGTCKGQCDGVNGKTCTFPTDGTVCTAASCTAGKATSASVCNGSGSCTTPTTNQCASNLCGTDGKCSGSCTASSCAAGTYCDATGACAKTLDLGGKCSSAAQCASGNCVDGVCCDGKCDGNCESCATGKCSASTSPRTPCGGSGKCAATCDPSNTKTCTFPKTTTVCKDASCTAGNRTPEAYCDGAGACQTTTAAPCPSNLCSSDGKSCSGSCTSTSCGAGTYCNGTSCVPKKPSGTCSNDVECSSGYCTDGMCCNARCNGQCESCAAGTCNASTTPRTPCGGNGKCAGSCVSSNRTSCTFPDSTTTCLDAGCASNVYQPKGVCNGSGTCSVPATQACTYVCSTTGCTGNCKPGVANQCSTSGVPQQCGTDGWWHDLTACPAGKRCTGAGSCTCISGTECSGTCVDTNTNPSNCGVCGKICSGGTPLCSAGKCAECTATSNTCTGGKTCNTTTGLCACPLDAASLCGSCAGWTFNNGTESGWVTGIGVRGTTCWVSSYGTQTPTTTPTPLDGPALQMVFNGDSSTSCGVGIGTILCGGSGVSLSGKSLHASVYYVPGNGATSPTFPGTIYAYAETSSGGVDSMPVMTTSLTRYSWTPISATFGNSGATDLYLGIVVSVSNDSGGAGQALWFDNVYVQ